jgi:hypothetical protein
VSYAVSSSAESVAAALHVAPDHFASQRHVESPVQTPWPLQVVALLQAHVGPKNPEEQTHFPASCGEYAAFKAVS